ncbi:hypothetical protein HPB51_015189 [Rhipicephalus microplus]|uniref:DUF7041 domain-containing protein n=1 Tax=Rhipicephalus microplus TaxID=6941 RepID=A0A9J6F4L0_RHIMP|nr:hypothetical protein HPB51_015189 [Rhipicephalus microplus]
MTEKTATSSSSPTNESELKRPHFWPDNPRVWFSQVEARFQLRHIKSQETTYFHVVAAMPPAIADAIDVELASTPAGEKAYDEVRSAIMKRLELSKQSRLRQLLSHKELGDQHPSQLLHRITRPTTRQPLAQQASEEQQQPLLCELFLQTLPHLTRMILAGFVDVTLERLAKLANNIVKSIEP